MPAVVLRCECWTLFSVGFPAAVILRSPHKQWDARMAEPQKNIGYHHHYSFLCVSLQFSKAKLSKVDKKLMRIEDIDR
jgi:hypothetical protein